VNLKTERVKMSEFNLKDCSKILIQNMKLSPGKNLKIIKSRRNTARKQISNA